MARYTDCVPVLYAAGLRDMADWAEEARPLRMGGRGRTCRDIWDAAPQGDWLLSYAQATRTPRPALVRAAAACVRPALRFVPEGEDRPRLAVEAAEAWADEPTERNRQRAEEAAWAAGEAKVAAEAAWEAGAGAAGAAEEAAAGWKAQRAVDAARLAAWAHHYAEGEESESTAHAACAEEVRRLVPFLDLAGM